MCGNRGIRQLSYCSYLPLSVWLIYVVSLLVARFFGAAQVPHHKRVQTVLAASSSSRKSRVLK